MSGLAHSGRRRRGGIVDLTFLIYVKCEEDVVQSSSVCVREGRVLRRAGSSCVWDSTCSGSGSVAM